MSQSKTMSNERNLTGYGKKDLKVKWPNNARLALQIVLNYEEGGENCVLYGDKNSEPFLSKLSKLNGVRIPGKRRHNNRETRNSVEVNSDLLKKIYDSHNITILPSYTEGYPYVIDESLSRKRPVIIFKEIEHIIQSREGIFVSQRNVKSLEGTVNFIMKNYSGIQESMSKNKLPTKKEFVSQMTNILS